MPLPVEALRTDSNPDAVKEAIRRSIEACINEGKDAKQCAAIAYSIARERTGQELK